MKFLATSALIILASTCFAADSANPPSTLRDSIATALAKNPQTRSTDLFLQSVHFATKAAKASRLPWAQVSCSARLNVDTYKYDDLNRQTNGASANCGASAGVTLFDGGANSARYQAAKANELATRYLYDTADSRFDNTKGELAMNTFNAFLKLSGARISIEFRTQVLSIFKKFLPLVSGRDDSDLEKQNLNAAIKDVEALLTDAINEESTQVDEFEHYVTLAPADRLESMDDAIDSMKVPATPEAAEAIALSSGPDVLRRGAEVEMLSWSLRALRAQQGPQVSLNASVNRGNYFDRIGPTDYANTNKSVGVTLTIPFNFGQKHQVSAAKKALESKEHAKQAAIAEAKHTIRKMYSQLANAKTSYLNLDKNYRHQLANVQSLVARVEAGERELKMSDVLSSVNSFRQQYGLRTEKQFSIITSLFSIQQATGLLLEKFAPSEKP